MNERNRAIFLDRDGVINEEMNYLSNPDDFKFIKGSIEALKILKHKGYFLILITNQAGIARGYFSLETLNSIHQKMNDILAENDIFFDDIFFCPHHPDFTGDCECRKPKPGMLLQAKAKHGIKLVESFMVGDTLNDIQAGYNAHCKTVLVLSGYGLEEKERINNIMPDFIHENLLEFAKSI